MLLWLTSAALAGPLALGAGVSGNLAPATVGNAPSLAPITPGLRLHLGEQAMVEVAGYAGLRSESRTVDETDEDDITTTTADELGGLGVGGGAHLRVRAASLQPTSLWLGIGASGSRWRLSGEEGDQQETLDRTVTSSELQAQLSVAAVQEITPKIWLTADLGLVPWARSREIDEVARRSRVIEHQERSEDFVGAWLRGALWLHLRL